MPKLPPHIVWPGIVIALLLMSVTMVTVTVVFATRDPSFAVESDYYERGLNWDDEMAQAEQNAELGWDAAPEVAAEADALHRRVLSVTLTDRDGAPIEGAEVEASVFHYTSAHQIQTETLVATDEPGVYEALFAIDRDGRWKLDLTVVSGDERFTDEQTLELSFE